MNGRNGKERRAGHGIGILMDGAMGGVNREEDDGTFAYRRSTPQCGAD